ncbi:MAG: ubiquinone/menaquinone biosynthesis C-methylase UbiE [Hyphomicrobiaceae bacterium]|jgi:ubiquinone/menaquinone biosynthesis C-methylase UbiE
MPDLTLTDRLLAVFEALDISRAHIATQTPSDISKLVEASPERIAGIVLLAPPRMDPTPFVRHASDVLYIAPAGGTLGRTAKTILPQMPNAQLVTLDGYDAESWDDIAVDRSDVADVMSGHLSSVASVESINGKEISGEVAGIRYHACGHGPTLVLTPLSFAPSQWLPLLPVLSQHFRVVTLSGPHLGMLALLEQRAALTGWRNMCAGAFSALNLQSKQRVLEVGCGSGAIARQFVQHTTGRNPLTAIDLSPYLLGEARHAAQSLGLEDRVDFVLASAEELPFDSDAFDAAYSVTVFEECNAERAISELMRVVRPGGNVAIIVRAIDLTQWWNLPISPEIRAKIEIPAGSVAPNGVATAALYDLATAAGLKPSHMYPYIVASETTSGPVFEFPEAHALAQLTSEEQTAYQAAKEEAVKSGTIFLTRGHHCFIGQVPK